MSALDAELASRMARIALGHVTREYPHKLDHVLDSDADALPPRVLHPIFYGSFDWHSCVHGWWTLLTLRRLFPQIEHSQAIAELASDTFTRDKVAAELAYLARPSSRGFERPYGWAWLLQLHLEAARHGESWGPELEPLACAFAERLRSYLAIMSYPIRVGTHFNTSFALRLAAERDALLFVGDHYFLRLFGVRLRWPQWLAPGQLVIRHQDIGGGRFVFALDLIHPWLGELAHQVALFADPVEPK